MRWLAFAAALIAMATLAGQAVAGDSFDSARYYIGIKQTAKALELVDSGEFDVNQQTDEGYSLLHYAAEAGDMAMVKALLARGANPNLKSARGLLPYDMAYATLVKAELRKAMTGGVAATASSATPGKPAAPGMCAKVRAETLNDGRSPAMRPFLRARDSVWYNNPDELTGLIEDCVKVDWQDDAGWTLLHQAADRDRVAIAKILLDHGASKALRNRDGQTAASLAKSPEMKALLGPAPAAPVSRPTPGKGDSKECQQKYQADVALCSDTTCRMRSMRKWQQCLKTGSYW